MRGEQLSKSTVAEALGLAANVCNAIGEQEQRLALVQPHGSLGPVASRPEAQKRPAAIDLADPTVVAHDQWSGMTAAAEHDVVRLQAQAQRAARRHRRLLTERRIEVSENRCGSLLHLADDARAMPHEPGQGRRFDTLADHIPKQNDPAGIGREELKEVATDLLLLRTRRLIERR